ncbi:hypothetical protein BT69DRAFT_1343625 [Atractiella rhizophila]|nr:hypothetical protein BT69DRAFT_1343625 [Atractiella rhizophila]
MPYSTTEEVKPIQQAPDVPRIQNLMITGGGVYIFTLDGHKLHLGREGASDLCVEILKHCGRASAAPNTGQVAPS